MYGSVTSRATDKPSGNKSAETERKEVRNAARVRVCLLSSEACRLKPNLASASASRTKYSSSSAGHARRIEQALEFAEEVHETEAERAGS